MPIAQKMDEETLRKLAKLYQRLGQLETSKAARENFLPFVNAVWPNFIAGRHHRIVAEKLEAVANGTLKRLIICMPPRHTKSEFASFLFPAWFIGRKPDLKIMQATHTADLSIRFGRKVRNLMDGDDYRKVFPDVKLRADSKAAYRWETDEGGEYYACLTPKSLVHTVNGPRTADSIRVGDKLLNCGDPVTVRRVYAGNMHDATVTVAGLSCSKDHPIWTMNRGWVYAGDLLPNDLLSTESISDKLKALVRRSRRHAPVEHAHVSTLAGDFVPLSEPARREVASLWGAGDLRLRAVEGLRKLFGRHGDAPVALAYSRTDGQRRAVQPGELSVGDTASAVEQHSQKRPHRGADYGAARAASWSDARDHRLPHPSRPQPLGRGEGTEEELRAYGDPEGLGWVRRLFASFASRCLQGVCQSGRGAEGYLARAQRAAVHVSGFLLGIRPAGHIRVEAHEPRPFINFLTGGDHTFFANGVLTHNCGVGGSIAGRGADLFIVDDPHSEQDAMSPTALENTWEWYMSGPRQRLQPGGAIVVVMTRWGEADLTARLLRQQAMDPKADKWEVVEFPAILDSGEPLWPEYWKLDELEKIKASISASKWQAQYMQRPTSDASSIVKREWWRIWGKEDVPRLQYVIQSYDTAFLKSRTADYSAIQTWGVFYPTEDSPPNCILLDAKKGRWEFPDLKRIALEEYKYWEPETVLIEAKASGLPLTQELRAMGIPVVNFTPSRGNDKHSRVNAVSPLFESGLVWRPETSWAEEVVEELAAFPFGENDDMVDCVTQALMRFRQGGFIAHPDDYQMEVLRRPSNRVYY